jgi:secondary thiamine-phosphate synthase enzyme
MVQTRRIELKTKGHCDIIDITRQVAQEVAQTGLKDGSGLLSDLRGLFDRVVPTDIPYQHDRRWGDGNGHAHVRASLLGASLTVPFVDKRLTLGTWQQIVFLDFDNRPRSRQLVLQIMGE